MKLENQVCTIEQAKKLKELGVIQDSLFYYRNYQYSKHKLRHNGNRPTPNQQVFNDLALGTDLHSDYVMNESYSAFTVAELGELLPRALQPDGHNWSYYHRHCWKGESVGYTAFGMEPIEQGWHTYEATARAEMLIKLLESGKITAEECNNRLKISK
jgi:hypothetical protein